MKTRTSYRGFWLLFALTAVAGMAVPELSEAQYPRAFDRFSGGRTYLIAFPDTVTNTWDQRFPPRQPFQLQLFIYSGEEHYSHKNTTVTISRRGNRILETTVKAGEFTSVDLSVEATHAIVTESEAVSDNVFVVEAEEPILIYCFMSTMQGGEAWTPLPVESWGKNYYAATRPGETVYDMSPLSEMSIGMKPKAAPAYILVIAAHNNTKVTMTPSSAGAAPIEVTLDENQAYLVQSRVDTADGASAQEDFAGYHVSANKIIGVVTGNTRVMVDEDKNLGISRNSFKNMLIESLAPTDQHGTEFVFMPSWDEQRVTGETGENIQHKRPAEYARMYGTEQGTTNGTYTDLVGGVVDFSMDNAAFHDERFTLPKPHVFKTDQPAQAMMNSSATIKFNGTQVYWGSYVGLSYNGWGAYMTEMTPREQWVSFASFIAPNKPGPMNHYINVVTDSVSAQKVRYKIGGPDAGAEQMFVFNRGGIPGTDLVWGTMQIVAGNSYYIAGINSSVKFSGFVYGSQGGYELHRPGKANKGDAPSPLHPSEYEEDVTIAYGYPLAPLRRALSNGDVTKIDSKKDGDGFLMTATIENSDYAGFRSIELSENSKNMRLEFVAPARALEIIGTTVAVVKVSPIDPSQPVTGGLVIIDRAGKSRDVPYPQTVSDVNGNDGVDGGFSLSPNRPNPLTETTSISFSLAESGQTTLIVYNALGRRVATLVDADLAAGRHTAIWNAVREPAGVYTCELRSGDRVSTQVMIVQ